MSESGWCARAMLALLPCLAACRGVGGTRDGEGWITEAGVCEATFVPGPLASAPTHMPTGTLLPVLISSHDGARVHVVPVPIVSKREIGLVFSVRW